MTHEDVTPDGDIMSPRPPAEVQIYEEIRDVHAPPRNIGIPTGTLQMGAMLLPFTTGNIVTPDSPPGTGVPKCHQYEDVIPAGSGDSYCITLCSAYGSSAIQ